jgi:hypothetical protein
MKPHVIEFVAATYKLPERIQAIASCVGCINSHSILGKQPGLVVLAGMSADRVSDVAHKVRIDFEKHTRESAIGCLRAKFMRQEPGLHQPLVETFELRGRKDFRRIMPKRFGLRLRSRRS